MDTEHARDGRAKRELGPDLPESGCGLVELGTWSDRVVGREAQAEAIAFEAGKDVEMEMEDLLAGSLALGEEEVDAFATKNRAPQSCCRKLPDLEELRAVFGIEVGETFSVSPWDDQHVAGHDWLDVHKRHRPLVRMDDADLGFAGDEATDQAVTRHRTPTIYNRKFS